jgi:lipopolysaccharide/colanic/teichoic acid biosynthesis glycosyltransferase
MIKRIFDIVFSFIGLVILLPFFVLFALMIVIGDGFPVIYGQVRVGKDGKDFRLYKFRTMVKDADKKGLITVGGKDKRITRTGYFLRKYKIDELPQLFNVFIGNMSLVGPRPEVRKYVELYTEEQKKVLSVKPGITDPASIAYSNENELLGKSSDPDATYISTIMPAKLRLNLEYIGRQSFKKDILIIFRTLLKIISK